MTDISWDAEENAFVLRASVLLPSRRSQVFDFFSDAANLEELTPPWLNFRILTELPIEMCEGATIDYRIRLRAIPIRWRTRISSWDPPFSFTDSQIRGPYLLWEHLHTFEEQNGGTLCGDHVRYRVPGGDLVHRLVVRRDLEKIFAYRRQRMQEIFGVAEAETGIQGTRVVESIASR